MTNNHFSLPDPKSQRELLWHSMSSVRQTFAKTSSSYPLGQMEWNLVYSLHEALQNRWRNFIQRRAVITMATEISLFMCFL